MDSTPEENSATPKEPSRKGLLAFVQDLRKGKTGPEQTPAPSEVLAKPLDQKGPLYHHFREFQWAAQQNLWLRVSLVVHVFLLALIWFGFYLAYSRPTYIQIAAPSLTEASKNFFGVDYNQVDSSLLFDQLSFFSISALTQLYQLDPDGANYVNLLQGMVDPTIIDRAKKNYEKNKQTVVSQRFIQSLVIQRIYPPITNTDTQTMAVFINGYLAISLQDQSNNAVNRIVPYRAKLLLRITPPSTLNPFPFFMEELTDVFGTEACQKWEKDNKKYLSK